MSAASQSSPLKGIKDVFVDGRDAVVYARACGVADDVRFRTTAPSLSLSRDPSIHSLEDARHVDKVARYLASILPFAKETRQLLADEGPHAHVYDVVMSRLMGWYLKMVKKALVFENADFTEPRGVVEIRSGKARIDGAINTPWYLLLGSNPQARRFHVDADPGVVKSWIKQEIPDLYHRIRYMGWRNFLVKGIPKLAGGLWGSKGTFFVTTDNPLLHETAWALWREGYAIKPLQIATPEPIAADEDLSWLRLRFQEYLGRYLRAWPCREAAQRLETMFWADIEKSLGQFRASRLSWARRLKEAELDNPRAILSNQLIGTHQLALRTAARDMGVPSVSFQHGHRREFAPMGSPSDPVRDEATSDFVVVYSQMSREATLANEFRIADVIVAGVPKDYARSRTYRSTSADAAPLMYVSTRLYSMHVQFDVSSSDVDLARQEIALIEEVFGVLPHRLSFKPYPKLRYSDPDPVIEAAKTKSNLRLIDDHIDLRYILSDCRLVIVSRATSTVGWVLLSGVPTVLIDWPNDAPLRADAKEDLSRVVFYFDASKPDFHRALRDFLSRPIADIEAEWDQAKVEREEIYRRYFAESTTDAGRIAARALLEKIAAWKAERRDQP